ncbi:MAG: putative bifunctional diguanylate cyclase/phosphodiesterase, partial [Bacteroidota bacterium]
ITARRQIEETLQEKETVLSESQRIAHIGSWRIELASGCISWSDEMYRLYGVAPETFAHSLASYLALIHPGDVAAVQAWHSACLAGEAPQELDFRIIRPDGKVRVIRGSGEVQYDEAGRPFSMVGSAQDITERRTNEERLRQAAAVFESIREGVTMTDAQERILMVNRAFSELTGYAPEDVLGQTPRLLKSGRHDRDFYAVMWAAINATGHWHGEVWNRRKNGEIFPQLLSISAVRDEAGRVTHYVGVSTDISQRKDAEARLDFLAHHDPLTRLPNRLLLYTRLQHCLDVSHRERKRLALLMLDLDRFKDVNDSFGHLAGDELLQQVAKRLTVRRRGADTVTRLGGDEFAVLLEALRHPQDAAQVASKIIAALSKPYRLSNGAEVCIGASVGISLFPEHGQTLEALLQQADAALYQAKGEGRGNFKYFSDDLTSAARSRINLEALLRRALIRDELRVHYQPQIEITSGHIVGAEALVRWQEPTEGLIPPSRFIPVAEETGLIAAIGEWVLRETCRQGQQWIEAGLPPLNLAVNLSSHQFRHGDISATVAKVLAETGFPAERLELELTESTVMEREAEAVEILQRLRALGVRLAIDDFGTGHSSLAYLKRFPLDVLKIDKSFVDDIPRLQDDMEIAAAIVALGHTLRLKVLAEGVETAEQLVFLRAQGCDLYQGYYRSQPVPAEAFVTLLQREA